ncbi:MAG: 50S ribosomal protein L6 [Clostridiaceae bacterium]|nr:50S ribosomal protein L6 [Clostridiaceae bacterium]
MSRIGRMPIPLPEGTKVEIGDEVIKVSKGDAYLEEKLHEGIHVVVEDQQILVTRENDSRMLRSLHGLTRSLINNMVHGLNHGFFKNLEIVGVGYRAELDGDKLVMHLGYSHPVIFDPPAGITFEVPRPTRISVRGADKQLVGELAAKIRASRPPNPYKGSGVRYSGEVLRLKVGKSGVKGG